MTDQAPPSPPASVPWPDLAGDRKRARSAMRHAIELEAGSASG